MLRFKLWLSEGWNMIIFVLACFAAVIALGAFTYSSVTRYNNVKNRVALVKKDAKINNKYFSQLYVKEQRQPNSKKDVVLTFDLYMKKPFIQTYQLNTQLKYFVQSVQDKYNIQGNHVRAIGIRLYDRKIVWDKGLQPRAIAFYAVQQEIAHKELVKQDKKNSKQNKDQKIKQLDGTTDNLDTSNQEALPTQAWDYTINNTKPINYNQYDLTVIGYSQYSADAVTHPLTDQEFAFWLKMKLYQKILNTQNVDSAAILYLNYDLGGNVTYNDFVTISKDFEQFDKRESDMGDNTDYYPNQVTLDQQLAIYRPQLLYYVMSGQMVASRTEAQRKLIQAQPDEYSAIIKKHNQEAAKTTDKYGKQNYYHGDPFVSILGPYKKKYPTFSRPAFSPELKNNSAFFNVTTAPDASVSTDVSADAQ